MVFLSVARMMRGKMHSSQARIEMIFQNVESNVLLGLSLLFGNIYCFGFQSGKYIFCPPNFLSKLKNREEFEGGLEKGREKGGKEEKEVKSDKAHFKIPL